MSQAQESAPWAAALGRIPSGLFIVTARQGDDETGMLASWVQQCAFDPPAVSVAVAKDRAAGAWLTDGAPFCVNLLGEGQASLIAHFGKGFGPGEPAFEGLDVQRPEGAPPVLSGALGYLECRVTARYDAGDHDLVLGRIVGGGLLNEGTPMVHVRKNGLRY